MAFKIRPASSADVPACFDIYYAQVQTSTATFEIAPISLEAKASVWFPRSAKYPFLVAEGEDGLILAYGYLGQFRSYAAYENTVEITVYVHHDYPRQGLGSSLINSLIKMASEFKFKTVLALISAENEASLKLFSKMGFVFCGRMKQVGYKFDRWIDVDTYQVILP